MASRLSYLADRWTWGHTALTVAFVFVMSRLLGPVNEPDLYWHLLLGRHIFTSGDLSGDPSFTFGPHQSWVSTQAAAEVLGFWWLELAGWGGFVLLRVLGGLATAAALAWAVYTCTPRALSRSFRLWVTALTCVVAMQYLNVQERPQTVTFILLPILGYVLIRMVYTGWTPPVVVLFLVVAGWTCLHGGSLLVVPVLAGGYVLRLVAVRFRWLGASGRGDKFWLRGATSVAVAFIATLANPLGWGMYERGAAIAASANVGIIEWKAPWPEFPIMGSAMWIFLAMLAFAAALLWKTSFPRRVFIVDVLFLLPFLAYSQTANRAVPIAVLITAPLIARRWSQAISVAWTRPLRVYAPRAAIPLAASAVALIVAATGYAVATATPVGPETPQRILSGLSQTVGERNVIGSYNITGRLQLLTQPQVRTGLDGRADRYSPEQLRTYFTMVRGEGDWLNILATAYAGTTDFVDVIEAGAVPKLMDLGWREVCREDTTEGTYVWLVAPEVTGSCPTAPLPLVAKIDR